MSTREGASEASAVGDVRTSSRRWWLVAVLMVVTPAVIFGRASMNFVVDPVRASFALSDTQFSLLQGIVPTLSLVLAAPAWGWLADRFPRRPLLMLGLALVAAGAAICALAPSFFAFASGRVIISVGGAALLPIALTLISDRFEPREHGRALGLFYTGLGVSPGLAAAMAGIAVTYAGGASELFQLSHSEPWRGVLAITAIPALLVAALVATVAEPVRRGAVDSPPAQVGAVNRRPVLLGLVFAAVTLLTMADEANLSWLATVLTRDFSYTPKSAGFTLALIAVLGGGAGPLLGGWISDRVFALRGTGGRLVVCATASAGAAVGMLVYLTSMPVWITVAQTMSALCLTAAVTIAMIVLQEALPAHRKGVATGAIYAGIAVLAGIGPTLVPLAGSSLGGAALPLHTSVALAATPLVLLAAIFAWVSSRVAPARDKVHE